MTPSEVFQRFERRPEDFICVPSSTYRLQLGPEFTFAAVREIVPYLAALGVSDAHFSPILQPCSAGSHGYDVADHGRFNDALGGEAEHAALVRALRDHAMGQIMDVVPNHMGIAGRRNTWWVDVLENGPASSRARFFDIDWDPVKPELKDKVLLPFLGDQYGRVLEGQELRLELEQGGFGIRYHDAFFPVAPRTYAAILEWRLDELEARVGPTDPHLIELRSIVTALSHLPLQTEQDPARLVEREREKEVVKRRLAALTAASAAVRAFLEDNVRRYNGRKGEPRTFDRLDDLLGRQAYRLSFWQVAGDEINYRRFFDINELAAIRMEESDVFEAAHRTVFRLVREGAVTGLRIDHPDGLFAPARYLRELQRRCFLERARYLRRLGGDGDEEPEGWAAEVLAGFDHRGLGRAFHVVSEKILMPAEQLPADWLVSGTTGYEFLNAVNGLFVDLAGARSLGETYARFIGIHLDFEDVAYESKRLVMDTTMASEIAMLGRRLGRISERRRSARDFTDRMLTEALREIVACFPVYRTYLGDEASDAAERDLRYVTAAVAAARRRNPSISASVFSFVESLLRLELPGDANEHERRHVLDFVGRFQQLTGPFTAKGVEDTAFYRYHRLISLNEVGGHPGHLGRGLEDFHRLCRERVTRWPAAASVLSTHDTKRGEDARARINVLSEIPIEWRTRVRVWRRVNRAKKMRVEGRPAPDANEEYLLYQTLLGAWPPAGDAAGHDGFPERVQRYVYKALREAKVNVSWINPRPEYDDAVRRFVARVLDRSGPNEFLDDFLPFQARVAELGIYNSLSQTVLTLTAPGIPELYQGAELWELSLVDPDNRRPVDFTGRRAALEALRDRIAEAGTDLSALVRELLERRHDGHVKLYVVHRALSFRRQHRRLFLHGSYVPLETSGARAAHVCAFARSHETHELVVAVPRWVARLGGGPPLGAEVWGEDVLVLPEGAGGVAYRDEFTGATVTTTERDGRRALPLASVFSQFPVAMLARAPRP